FYNQIFEDLNIAEKNLEGIDQPEYGRVTVWAVRSMLARMYLYRKNYQKAFEYANMVIQNGGFELASSPDFLWNINNTEYSKNKEVIWSVIYASTGEPDNFAIIRPSNTEGGDPTYWPDRHGNNLHLNFLCYYQSLNPNVCERSLEYGRAFVRFMPTLFLLDLYDETVDLRFNSYFRSVYRCNKENKQGYAIGDTVIYFSKYEVPQNVRDSANYFIYDRSDMFNTTTEFFTGDRNFYFSLNKFLDPNRNDKEDAHSGRDVFVFRLSEMYFIAAEAKLFTTGAADAYDYLKAIADNRAVGGDGAAMLSKYGVTSDGTGIDLDFILDEKGREFCGEYIRWFDLKRTDKLIERVKAHNPDAANIKDFHVVRPIPQSQIDAVTNKTEFTQNPGYN
ncbi:MAG: RagB/SusD family nutrient uptake outer membrane protein, partial [Bacteroidales bacterium]|nr:RagB/SusD family nutrient uptake outer membrane protein [Bacteroidales bacterium]